MNLFIFDNSNNTLRLDDDEKGFLLVKEFSRLWDPERNKCKEDPSGKERRKAFKEFTFIYLMLDFKSPYFQYLEQEKYDAALIDSGLDKKDLEDPLFSAAYKKYEEIQDSDRILALIRTAYHTLHKMQVFLDNIDFSDTDEMGKPLYKPKDVIADISSIAKMRIQLQELETEHKKDLAASSKTRGGHDIGFDEA